jgi:hypothetical protein
MDPRGEPARRAVEEELPEWTAQYPAWRFWRFALYYAWRPGTSPPKVFSDAAGWDGVREQVDAYLNGR